MNSYIHESYKLFIHLNQSHRTSNICTTDDNKQ